MKHKRMPFLATIVAAIIISGCSENEPLTLDDEPIEITTRKVATDNSQPLPIDETSEPDDQGEHSKTEAPQSKTAKTAGDENESESLAVENESKSVPVVNTEPKSVADAIQWLKNCGSADTDVYLEATKRSDQAVAYLKANPDSALLPLVKLYVETPQLAGMSQFEVFPKVEEILIDIGNPAVELLSTIQANAKQQTLRVMQQNAYNAATRNSSFTSFDGLIEIEFKCKMLIERIRKGQTQG